MRDAVFEGRGDTSSAGATLPVARIGVRLVITVVLLTAIAPLATDMYVPAFPRVSAELSAGATQVQLTLTTFFAGMALGQLIGGPVSDQLGRRRLLIMATVVMTAGSALCALAPTITIMMLARFVQGFSGGWAMVIGRAVIVDLARGAQLVRVLNVIAGVGGLGPIVGPLAGAVILQLSDWRMSFWLLTAIGLLMTLLVALIVPESLPVDRRRPGGLAAFARSAGEVLRHRRYVGYVLVTGSAMIIVFAYVATSAFILQTMNGVSPVGYSVDFAANAGAMTLAALVSARLAGRVATRTVIFVGQAGAFVAGVAMLAGALWLQTPLLLAIGAFVMLMTAHGLITPNGGALAAAEVPEHPGTGSAVLGCVQWIFAGAVAPIAGLGGSSTAVPMAVIMIIGALVSMAGLVLARAAAPTPAEDVPTASV